MPCRKQIKSNLYDTVDRLSSTGYGKNIRGAQAIANLINKQFDEEVVTFRLGDTIEREIYISPTLVDQYFEKELQLEIEEARKVQRLECVLCQRLLHIKLVYEQSLCLWRRLFYHMSFRVDNSTHPVGTTTSIFQISRSICVNYPNSIFYGTSLHLCPIHSEFVGVIEGDFAIIC